MAMPTFQTPTLREAVAYWLTHAAPARTRDQYATLLRVHWLPAFGDLALDRITGADVAAVLERLRLTHTAGTVETIRKALATASTKPRAPGGSPETPTRPPGGPFTG